MTSCCYNATAVYLCESRLALTDADNNKQLHMSISQPVSHTPVRPAWVGYFSVYLFHMLAFQPSGKHRTQPLKVGKLDGRPGVDPASQRIRYWLEEELSNVSHCCIPCKQVSQSYQWQAGMQRSDCCDSRQRKGKENALRLYGWRKQGRNEGDRKLRKQIEGRWCNPNIVRMLTKDLKRW